MTLDPISVLDSREKLLPNYSYKLGNGGQYGMDIAFGGDLDISESEASVWIPFADGNRRDGVGDILEVAGIDTQRHRANPIVLFDHGKQITLPIALAEDPATKTYMVEINPITKTARAKAFFYQGSQPINGQTPGYDHALFAEQLFDLIAKRYVRAGSIGYQVVKALPLMADYNTGTPQGLHLLKTLLLEVSAVVMPANQDTVRKALSMPKICGKPLSPMLVKSLSAYAPPRKAMMGYEGKAQLTIKPSKASSTMASASVHDFDTDARLREGGTILMSGPHSQEDSGRVSKTALDDMAQSLQDMGHEVVVDRSNNKTLSSIRARIKAQKPKRTIEIVRHDSNLDDYGKLLGTRGSFRRTRAKRTPRYVTVNANETGELAISPGRFYRQDAARRSANEIADLVRSYQDVELIDRSDRASNEPASLGQDLPDEYLIDSEDDKSIKSTEKIPGGRASGMKPADFDPKQLAHGTAEEASEHGDVSAAMEVAEDHLAGDPDYYSRNGKTLKSVRARIKAGPSAEEGHTSQGRRGTDPVTIMNLSNRTLRRRSPNNLESNPTAMEWGNFHITPEMVREATDLAGVELIEEKALSLLTETNVPPARWKPGVGAIKRIYPIGSEAVHYGPHRVAGSVNYGEEGFETGAEEFVEPSEEFAMPPQDVTVHGYNTTMDPPYQQVTYSDNSQDNAGWPTAHIRDRFSEDAINTGSVYHTGDPLDDANRLVFADALTDSGHGDLGEFARSNRGMARRIARDLHGYRQDRESKKNTSKKSLLHALTFLKSIEDADSLDEVKRMEAYYHAKLLGQKAVERRRTNAAEDLPDDPVPPELSAMLEEGRRLHGIEEAKSLLERIAFDKAFGLPHREAIKALLNQKGWREDLSDFAEYLTGSGYWQLRDANNEIGREPVANRYVTGRRLDKTELAREGSEKVPEEEGGGYRSDITNLPEYDVTTSTYYPYSDDTRHRTSRYYTPEGARRHLDTARDDAVEDRASGIYRTTIQDEIDDKAMDPDGSAQGGQYPDLPNTDLSGWMEDVGNWDEEGWPGPSIGAEQGYSPSDIVMWQDGTDTGDKAYDDINYDEFVEERDFDNEFPGDEARERFGLQWDSLLSPEERRAYDARRFVALRNTEELARMTDNDGVVADAMSTSYHEVPDPACTGLQSIYLPEQRQTAVADHGAMPTSDQPPTASIRKNLKSTRSKYRRTR